MANSWQLVPHRAAIPGELLAGMVVALGIIPEAIAFSIVAGVDPQVGLFGLICILIVVSLLGGRPGMVSACTAGVALLMGGLMQSHGLSYLLAASILAGVFQIIRGYLRLAQQMRFVPRAVTVGFVNAIGVLIFLAQLPQLGLGRDGAEVIPSLAASGVSVSWPWVWALVALGLLIIYQLPRLTRVVPSTLVAILVISGLAEWGQLPVPRVGDLGQLPTSLPLFQTPRNLAIAVLVGVAGRNPVQPQGGEGDRGHGHPAERGVAALQRARSAVLREHGVFPGRLQAARASGPGHDRPGRGPHLGPDGHAGPGSGGAQASSGRL